MEYPQEFVEAVKGVFPDWESLHQALDAGSDLVGRILDDTGHWAPDARKIVEMIDNGQVGKLRAEAERHAVARELYSQWYDIARR